MVHWVVRVIAAFFRPKASLVAENLCLRQQLLVLQRRHPRPRLQDQDRRFWILASRWCPHWRKSLLIVTPGTVSLHPMEDALLTAFEQLLGWVQEDYAADPVEAYMLLGQTLNARATAICNPKPTYLCKIHKSILKAFPRRDDKSASEA